MTSTELIYGGLYGWILFHRDGNKYIAHKAAASPAGTKFIPLFATKKAAIEYRDLRLEMPTLRAKRVTICEVGS